MAQEPLSPVVARLLEASGVRGAPVKLEPLPAGGNNRVYCVHAGAARFAAKEYFHRPGERDRLRCEHDFIEHAWRSGIRNVPRPFAVDAEAHIALYEFVAGKRISTEDMNAARVLAAGRFFAALNSPASRAAAASLPLAADACLSVAQHVASVDVRVNRLAQQAGEVDAEAAALMADLAERWTLDRARILAAFPDAEKLVTERCLSPSDFGFHNALERADGELCFLDFEYAGWDDPAKMAGDFFWHAGMRPPREHFDRFAAVAFAPFHDPAGIARRTQALSGAFRLRWACIALNEFLPEAATRRRFAGGADAAALERRRTQLEKARALLAEPDL